MKAYGIPRVISREFPDPLDIKEFGMASHVGQLITKSGEYKSYTRSSKERRATRIYWKKKERYRIKRIMYNESH